MDIVGTARKIERRLARSVDAAVGELVRRPAPAPIEMVHTAVELSEQRVQDVGRGRRVFPFNRVVLHVLTPAQDPEARTRFEAIAEGPPSLTDRLRERLQALGCDAAGVSAEVVFADAAAADWTSPGFHVEFLKVAPKPPLPRPVNLPPPLVRLTPVAGTTARRGYAFTAQRIDIGRGAEVLDGHQRVTRTNHVAFAEESDHLSSTVSRRHAHVVYVALSQEYRICDDRSAHGTAVLRDGRTIPVPPGTRGVRLQSGDEILLGKARLRVAIDTPPRAAPRRSR